MRSLWEFYCRNLLKSLDKHIGRHKGVSFVDWIGWSLEANSLPFTAKDWFVHGSKIRNLIAHEGARVTSEDKLPPGIEVTASSTRLICSRSSVPANTKTRSTATPLGPKASEAEMASLPAAT
jgi:hypothetical protein